MTELNDDFNKSNNPRNVLVALFNKAKPHLTKEELEWVADSDYSICYQTEELSSFLEEMACAVTRDGGAFNDDLVSSLLKNLSIQLSLLSGLAEISLSAGNAVVKHVA